MAAILNSSGTVRNGSEEQKKGCAQNNPWPPLVLTAESICVSSSTAVSQTACLTQEWMPFAVASLKGQSCQSIGHFNVCLSCMFICHSCACWQSQWTPYVLLKLNFLTSLWCFSSPEAGGWLIILDGPRALQWPRASAPLWWKLPDCTTWHFVVQTWG